MNNMTSAFLYGTVYDIHVFLHNHKWQFRSSMFFMEVNPGSLNIKSNIVF